MINNRDCFFYKKSDFINRLQDISPDSVCYIADTQQIYTHGRYFECNVTQDVVEQLIQNHGYLTAADLPVLTGGASPTPGEYVSGVSVGGHNINVQKGKLSEINVGTASKLETPRKIELSGDLSGSIMFDGSQDVNIETIVHNSTTADRLTTPRTISLSSQATGQVSFDGSGNVNIPVTVNELDSKNSNNQDLNSLVTLNGYGGSLFYGQGGNTSKNKPSGVDWFGLFSFKSASGNYTTQILGSKNRLYSRSNADTSLGSWNTIAYLTDNVASATKLQNTRTFTISDGTNLGTASNFNGTGNVTLRLPSTIHADIIGNVTGDINGDVTGNLHGNADTATKLQTGRNINGTLFDGTRNITTAQWGTARNLTIGKSTKSVNGSANISWTLSEIGAVNKAGDTMTGILRMMAGINLLEVDNEPTHLHGVFASNDWWDIAGYTNSIDSGYLDIRTGDNGNEPIYISQIGSSGNVVHRATILDGSGNTKFPGTITAPTFSGALSGNATTASKLATARTITLTGDTSGSASFDGSTNISIPVTVANNSHTHTTSASSNATTNLTITAGGTTATVADLYATYADRLRTARTISLTGDVTGSTSFNGAGNVSIATTVADNSHNHTFANISDKPISRAWQQNNNNKITTSQFLDLLEAAGAFTYGWFHTRGGWSYASTSNITDTGYGTIDLAGCAITVWGSSKSNCTVLIIPPLNSSISSSVALGNMYIYITNGEGYTSGWRKIARFEDINWSNITNKPSSFTPSSHTHTISQISNLNGNWDSLLANAPSVYLTRWPSISEVTGKQNLTIRLNGGTTEGTNQFTYNGTAAKTINITASNIGAASSSHTHEYVSRNKHVTNLNSTAGNFFGYWDQTNVNGPKGGQYGTVLQVNRADVAPGSSQGWAFQIANDHNDLGRLYYRTCQNGGYGQWYKITTDDKLTWGNITNKPSWIESSKPSYSWSEITDKPNSFTPSSHTHSTNDITSGTLPISRGGTGATTALAANYSLLNGFTRRDNASFSDFNYIAFFTSNPSTTVGALQGAPASRLYKYIADKLTPSAIGAAASSHTHSASNITSGTLSIARIPTGTTINTVALGSHTHSQYLTSSDLSNYVTESELSSAIDGITPASIGAASSSHTHGTDKITSLKGYAEGSSTATLSSLMTLNAALASLQNQIQTKATLYHTHGTYIEKDSGQYVAGWEDETTFRIGEKANNVGLFISLGAVGETSITTDGKFNAGKGFYETSDARLKDFKEDVKALDTVDQIPTKYFTWKEDENQESQIGTSAQEVEKLYPELVSKTEDDTLTVDYAKLSIIALAAIKELKAEIQSLKEEIKQLKSK